MKNSKTSWLIRHSITIFSCVAIIALGIITLSYASVTTSIGENIITNILTATGLTVNGTATTTNLVVDSGTVSLPDDSISIAKTSGLQTALDGKYDSEDLIDYSEFPVNYWNGKTELASCDNLFDAFEDNSISMEELATTTNITNDDYILMYQDVNNTVKISATDFQNEMNSVPADFGEEVTIVKPEDNFTTIFNNATFPQWFYLSPGEHTLTITGITDFSKVGFVGHGEHNTKLTIITDCENGDCVRFAGVCYFNNINIKFQAPSSVNYKYYGIQDTENVRLYIIDSYVAGGTYSILRTDGNTNKSIYATFINSNVFESCSGFLFAYPDDGAGGYNANSLKLNFYESVVGGTIYAKTSPIITMYNTEIDRLELPNLSDPNVYQTYCLINCIINNVSSFDYLLMNSATTNYYGGAGCGSVGETNHAIPIEIDSDTEITLNDIIANYMGYQQSFTAVEFKTLSDGPGIYKRIRTHNTQKYLIDLKITGSATSTFEGVSGGENYYFLGFSPEDYIMEIYLSADGNSLDVQTGFTEGNPTYTTMAPGSRFTVETKGKSVLPNATGEFKIYREITLWE